MESLAIFVVPLLVVPAIGLGAFLVAVLLRAWPPANAAAAHHPRHLSHRK